MKQVGREGGVDVRYAIGTGDRLGERQWVLVALALAQSSGMLPAAGAQVVGSPAALVEALRGAVNASLTCEDPV